MKINIRAVHFDLTDELRDYAAEKIGKLDEYYKNIIMAEIAIENHESEKKDQYSYIAKVKLSVPGNDLFADATGPDEFSAIDNAEGKLKIQVEKLKNKQKSKSRFAEAQDMFKSFFGKE